MESAALIKLIRTAINRPMLADAEIRFLHALYMRLLAHGAAVMTDDERQQLMLILADQQERGEKH
jgi:hypothetical protein